MDFDLYKNNVYNDIADLLEELIEDDDIAYLISKNEQIVINNFCLEYLLSLLEKNSIESTKQIIKDNLHNSNIRALNISLEYILRIFEEFEKKYNHDLEESIKKKYLLSLATDQETL